MSQIAIWKDVNDLGGKIYNSDTGLVTTYKEIKQSRKFKISGYTYEANHAIALEDIFLREAEIVYWDGSSVQYIVASKYTTSLGIPIGVVAIPEGFLPDGKGRIVSCYFCGSNGTPGTSALTSNYGLTRMDVTTVGLSLYDMVPITDNAGSTTTSSAQNGYLPSDCNITDYQSYVDPDAYYYTTANKIPSPYLFDGVNTYYYQKIEGHNNALSDFKGQGNTNAIYKDFRPQLAVNAKAFKVNNRITSTVLTQLGLEWYIPSMGELGFLYARLGVINDALSKCNCPQIPNGSCGLWSSTFNSVTNVYTLNYNRPGYACYRPLSSTYALRPFAILPPSQAPEPSDKAYLYDVAYWDGSEIKTISYDKYGTSLGTIIGIVVIEEGVLPDGRARIIPITSEARNWYNGRTAISWHGSSSGETTLPKYQYVPTTDNAGSTSTGSYRLAYETGCFLPSDNTDGDPLGSNKSYIDPTTYYLAGNRDMFIPSPYNGSHTVLNTEYNKTLANGNVFSNFDGETNTHTLINVSINHAIAMNAWYFDDGGTYQVQWYLPTAGELGLLFARLKEINKIMENKVGFKIYNNTYWTSTEYSTHKVITINFATGEVNSTPRLTNLPFIPFGKI